MSFIDEFKKYPSLEPYILKIKEKIEKEEELCCNLSKETLISLKSCIEKNEGDRIYFHFIQGLALIEKIKDNIEFYPRNKEIAIEDLKMGQEIQSLIKKEMGSFILKGKGNFAKEIQEFNYKLFEEIGPLRVFEEKEKIEEIEISLKPEKQKISEEERKKMLERASIVKNAVKELTIKKVEKKENKIGKKILYIGLILVVLGGIFTILNTRKGKAAEYKFNISDFPELPNTSNIEKGNFDLKITVSEEFWNNLEKKKKMEIVNVVSGKAQDKGYLIVNFFSDKGEHLAKWIKNERTYIYR